MIKATIQSSPYCTEITFPCTETELSKKLGELGMNPEHLAPMATVIKIEPTKLSMLEDCEVSLDALNYLGKRLDGMDKLERKQFLAVLSCDEAEIGYGLKNIINLTDNLARYTLIEDTDDLERVGLIHMLNARGGLSESEYTNSEWLIAEGTKLLESGKGIDTEYGKLFINEDIPFEEKFNGTTFPPYLYNGSPVTVDIGYMGSTEMVELPCEDISIKKAVCRLGADSASDCKIEISTFTDLPDDLRDKVMAIEKNKDIFGLNELVKTVDFSVKQEKPKSIFYREMSKWLRESKFEFFEKDGCMIVSVDDGAEAKIYNNGTIAALTENVGDEYHDILRAARCIYEYCSVYEKAAPLKAEGLSGNYRCLSEFNGTVFAAKYNEEYGFEFVTWGRTYDGKAVCQGNYYTDYAAAKENFAVRSGLVNKDKMFSTEELESIRKCINFTAMYNDDLNFDYCDFLKKISEKISENIPDRQQNEAPEISM